MKIRLNFVTKDLRTSNSIIHMSAHQFRELRSLLNYEWVDNKKKVRNQQKNTGSVWAVGFGNHACMIMYDFIRVSLDGCRYYESMQCQHVLYTRAAEIPMYVYLLFWVQPQLK